MIKLTYLMRLREIDCLININSSCKTEDFAAKLKNRFGLALPALLTIMFTLLLAPMAEGQGLTGGVRKAVPRSIVYGKWRFADAPDRYLEFFPNGEVLFRVENKDEDDKEYSNYSLEEVADTLYLMRINKNGYKERHAVRISGDYMATICFKQLEGITSHIDEYGIYVRDTVLHPRLFDAGKPITKYVLPNGFRGHVTIAFNQPDGVAPEYDAQGNCIVRIPASGLLKMRLREDAFATAARRYEISIADSTSQGLVRLPSIDNFELYYATALPKSAGVVVMGFNHFGREEFNRLWGQPMAGNIFMLFVADNLNQVLDDCKNGRGSIFAPWF